MNIEYNTLKHGSRQRGATLLVAMIMLVLISIIGFSAMQTTTMQERMTGNLKDKEISFQAAEAALRAKEKWLNKRVAMPEVEDAFSEYGDTGVTELKAVSADPKTRMPEKTFLPDNLDIGHARKTGVDIYRIEALGQGQSDHARTRLESTYARRFN